jgi:hypothetical protein
MQGPASSPAALSWPVAILLCPSVSWPVLTCRWTQLVWPALTFNDQGLKRRAKACS